MDLSEPLRTAVIGESTITNELAAYKGSFPVFTRRPVPDDAVYPMIVISSGMQAGEFDGLTDQRPVLVRDVLVYGSNETAAKYRQVEAIANTVWSLFNRGWQSILVSGWKVVEIIASGPSPAPTDDEQTVGRRIELTITLAKSN